MIKRFIRHNVEDAGSSGSLNDLSFLLIIFFIVIAGFNVNKGFLLNLPSKEKPVVVNVDDIIKCSLLSDGSIILDGKKIAEEELQGKVAEKLKKWPNMTFLLTIDENAPYQSVVNVIADVKGQKVENFSFRMAR
jgi:biopolymer transport protein ExbD